MTGGNLVKRITEENKPVGKNKSIQNYDKVTIMNRFYENKSGKKTADRKAVRRSYLYDLFVHSLRASGITVNGTIKAFAAKINKT